jgi:hypothetical protein
MSLCDFGIGRLSLTSLASTLNVSLGVVEARVADLLKQDRHIHNVLGQVVTSAYLDSLSEDLNEKLIQDGMISLSELSKTSDLPGEFLQDQIEKRIGKIIHGKQDQDDPSLIYTETFVRRNTARIRGILSAITKPTPINQILMKFGSNVPEKLFFGKNLYIRLSISVVKMNITEDVLSELFALLLTLINKMNLQQSLINYWPQSGLRESSQAVEVPGVPITFQQHILRRRFSGLKDS